MSASRSSRALAGLLLGLWVIGSGCTTLREIPRSTYSDLPERKGVRVETRDGLVSDFDYATFSGDSLTGYRHRSDIEGPVDYVLHWASPASPIDYLELPIQTLKVGSLGTHNALGLAMAKKARFVLASTSEVYGDPLEHPQKETYWGNVNPIGPRGVYDEAKRFAEAMTMAYHRYHGVDTRIVRIFNTFGPRMRPKDGRVVSNFIVQALQGKPLSIFGDGSQTRSFCYVDDLVRGILSLLMAESDKSHEERTDRKFLTSKSVIDITSSIHDPVNIGNPRELTVLEIANLVLKLTGSSSQIA